MSQRDIEAVSKGGDPKGFFLDEKDIAPSFANDLVIGASEINGDPDDPEVLRTYARQVATIYQANPPMKHLM